MVDCIVEALLANPGVSSLYYARAACCPYTEGKSLPLRV